MVDTVPGVVIAAASSNSGKTTIATGLIAALARNATVAPFKVGPDYIDPGYHGLAAGRVGRNLDSVMCGKERIAPLYKHGSAGADIAIVEGVMGLFDGRIPPDDGSGLAHGLAAGSTAEIAGLLDMPVILVTDASGMSQSMGAIVEGFAKHHPGVNVAGVIINKVGTPRHEAICRAACEAVGVEVVGALPRVHGVEVPSRHLGLVTAAERGQRAYDAVARMADLVADNVDLAAIRRIAAVRDIPDAWDPATQVRNVGPARVALAGGPAFTFAYAEHEELLRAAGAEVVRFDPLSDQFPQCDGLIIPGGFPEEHVEDLAARTDLVAAVAAHVAAGKPVHGECAGLLWLLKSLDAHPMLGVIPTHAAMGRRLTLGYREAVAMGDSLLYRTGERVVGHEFHHTALAEQHCAGFDAAWGWRGWDAQPKREGFIRGNVHASYLHVHPAAQPQAVERFVAAAAAAA